MIVPVTSRGKIMTVAAGSVSGRRVAVSTGGTRNGVAAAWNDRAPTDDDR